MSKPVTEINEDKQYPVVMFRNNTLADRILIRLINASKKLIEIDEKLEASFDEETLKIPSIKKRVEELRVQKISMEERIKVLSGLLIS